MKNVEIIAQTDVIDDNFILLHSIQINEYRWIMWIYITLVGIFLTLSYIVEDVGDKNDVDRKKNAGIGSEVRKLWRHVVHVVRIDNSLMTRENGKETAAVAYIHKR